jgi:hypothetical protein
MIAILNSHAARLALLVALVFLLLIVGITGCFWMVHLQISRSQAQWCDTLSLLTSHPVPYPPDAAKNPSRLADYQLYEDFVKVREEFGCRGG